MLFVLGSNSMKGANSAEGTTFISYSSKLLSSGNSGSFQVCASPSTTTISSRVMRLIVAGTEVSEIVSFSLIAIFIVSVFRAVLASLSVLKDSTYSS